MPTKDSCQIERLRSGMTVALRPMPQAASAAVGMWLRAGGRYEAPPHAGVSHCLEHLLFKGTRSRSCEQLKRAIEGVGGSLNGFTAEEFTCYMAKVPAAYARRAITILSDMVFHPSLSARDMEKERDVILEEIRMYDDAPGQAVHDLFNQVLWPNHPLGNLLSGTLETVKRLRRSDVVAYWKRMYHPRHAVVSCAGAFEPGRVLEQLRRVIGRRAGGAPQRFLRAPRLRRGPQVRLLKKTTEQTHLCLGVPAIPRTHPQRFALELLHVILGGNMSSRLFYEVREKRGLAYEIGSTIKRYHDTGAFVVYAGCDAPKLPSTIRTIIAELHRMKRELVRPAELQRAKEFYRGQLLMGLEDTGEHMLWIGEHVMTVGRVSSAHDVVQAINRVTPQQIREAARRLFEAARTYVAVMGPVDEREAGTLQALCGAL
jgi:predicted Zn-dependent peptidase